MQLSVSLMFDWLYRAIKYVLYAGLAAFMVVTVVVAVFHNPIGKWEDWKMVRSVNWNEIRVLISEIKRYEDERGYPPKSLRELSLPFELKPKDEDRYFRYTVYPKGNSEYREYVFIVEDGLEVEFKCNSFRKCVSLRKIHQEDELIELYGDPIEVTKEFSRDWELAAVLPAQYNMASDDSYELRYWKSEEYPDNGYYNSRHPIFNVDDWYLDPYPKNDTAYGKSEWFNIY
jgi:hypothetical protein